MIPPPPPVDPVDPPEQPKQVPPLDPPAPDEVPELEAPPLERDPEEEEVAIVALLALPTLNPEPSEVDAEVLVPLFFFEVAVASEDSLGPSQF